MLMFMTIHVEANRHTNLVIVGGTGDLARKYLWKSALKLYVHHEDENNTFSMYAGSRLPVGEGSLVLNQITDKTPCEPDDTVCLKKRPEFIKSLHYVQLKSSENYTTFCHQMRKLSQNRAVGEEIQIFYLSIPSSAYESVARNIHSNCRNGAGSSIKVVLEKPFGRSKETAAKQADMIETYFSDDEVYRVDHYLAKSVTKQILNFRYRDMMDPFPNDRILDWSILRGVADDNFKLYEILDLLNFLGRKHCVK